MPGNLSIRTVDDDLIMELKRRVATNGRSTESEIREILREPVERGKQHEDYLARLAEIRAMTAGRPHTPSEVLIREDRDSH